MSKRKIGILGAGESGVGAAVLANKNGYEVWVSDYGLIPNHYKIELQNLKVDFEESKHSVDILSSCDLVVKSPGIANETRIVQTLLANGTRVISEVEFAFQHCSSDIIAITGSNGKTTTTKLVHHILHTCGVDVGLGGNIGSSFSREIAQNEPEMFVLEASSFQLENIEAFKPKIAILLNITPDHLDRYQGSMVHYGAAKFNVIRNQDENDIFVYNQDDDEIRHVLMEKEIAALMVPVKMPESALTVKWDWESFSLAQSELAGRHNAFNATCAVAVALLVGCNPEEIQLALDTFEMETHRMEVVTTISDVEYINDSKATNVESVFFALEAMSKPIIWIVGGQDKGNDYEKLNELVKNKIKHMICMGVDNAKLFNHFQGLDKPMDSMSDIDAVVRRASEVADSGDVVLLSPACASFDLFKNYKERGELFKKAVLKL